MSLINQMLKDIDKRHSASSSMSPSNQDLQGVIQEGFTFPPISMRLVLLTAMIASAVVVFSTNNLPFFADAKSPPVLASSSASLPPKGAPSQEAPVLQMPISATPMTVASMPMAPFVAKSSIVTSELTPAEIAMASTSTLITSDIEPIAATPSPAPAFQIIPLRSNPKVNSNSSISQVLTTEQRAENLYRDSVEQIRQGRMVDAQGLLKRSLTIYPLHHAARQLLARSMLETGQSGEVQDLLRDGLRIAPQQYDFYMALAHVHLSDNNLDAAIKVMESGLPKAMDNAEYNAFLAALLQRTGRHEEAIKNYVIALRKAPDAANWLLGLAISLQAQTDKASAAEAYQRAINSGLTPSLLQFAQDRLAQLSN